MRPNAGESHRMNDSFLLTGNLYTNVLAPSKRETSLGPYNVGTGAKPSTGRGLRHRGSNGTAQHAVPSRTSWRLHVRGQRLSPVSHRVLGTAAHGVRDAGREAVTVSPSHPVPSPVPPASSCPRTEDWLTVDKATRKGSRRQPHGGRDRAHRRRTEQSPDSLRTLDKGSVLFLRKKQLVGVVR